MHHCWIKINFTNPFYRKIRSETRYFAYLRYFAQKCQFYYVVPHLPKQPVDFTTKQKIIAENSLLLIFPFVSVFVWEFVHPLFLSSQFDLFPYQRKFGNLWRPNAYKISLSLLRLDRNDRHITWPSKG